jgi:hypothetical protein
MHMSIQHQYIPTPQIKAPVYTNSVVALAWASRAGPASGPSPGPGPSRQRACLGMCNTLNITLWVQHTDIALDKYNTSSADLIQRTFV